jgi:hypothetical protein
VPIDVLQQLAEVVATLAGEQKALEPSCATKTSPNLKIAIFTVTLDFRRP